MPVPAALAGPGLLPERRRGLWRLRRSAAGPGPAGAGAVQNLLQFLAIQLRRLRLRNPIFVRNDVGLRPLGQLLLVRRKLQVSEFLLAHQVFRTDHNHGALVHQAFEPGGVDRQNDDCQVDHHRDPEGFPLPRAREIVLQLNQQGGNIVHLDVGGFPTAGVVKIAARGGGRLRWQGRDFAAGFQWLTSTCWLTALDTTKTDA